MPATPEETPRDADQDVVIPDPKPTAAEAEIAADDAGASAMAERIGKAEGETS